MRYLQIKNKYQTCNEYIEQQLVRFLLSRCYQYRYEQYKRD